MLIDHSKGEKVTAKAHGGQIDIQGITVAKVDDKVRLQSVETWFDPMEMFRQIAPNGIVNKVIQEPASSSDNTSQLPTKLEGDQITKDAVTASGSTTEQKLDADQKGEAAPGNAVVAPAESEEVKLTHEEMSNITPAECPFLMNKE